MTYVLSIIGDRTYILTEDKVRQLDQAITAGLKVFRIGDSRIYVHQITSIDPIDTYHRQMKTKLAAKGLKLCKRCWTTIPLNDKCPCVEKPEKYPDILEQARLENPAFAKQLDALAESKALPHAS